MTPALHRRFLPRTIAVPPFVLAVSAALADATEDAPQESRDQVAAALDALAPAFTGRARHIAAGQPGTLEAAISAYAPGRFHPVVEGSLAPRRPRAACPGDMGLVA